MKVAAIIFAVILLLGVLGIVIYLAIDIIRTIKAKKSGKTLKKPKKEKDIDYE